MDIEKETSVGDRAHPAELRRMRLSSLLSSPLLLIFSEGELIVPRHRQTALMERPPFPQSLSRLRFGALLHRSTCSLCTFASPFVRYVEGRDLFVCGNYVFNHYRDCQDANYFLCGDKINDVLCLPYQHRPELAPVLACQDRVLRILSVRIIFAAMTY